VSSFQVIINRLLAHKPRRNHFRISIRQDLNKSKSAPKTILTHPSTPPEDINTYLRRQHPRNPFRPIHPPKTITQTHPPQAILASPARTRFRHKEPTKAPALRRIPRLRKEFRTVVDERWIRWGRAAACEVWSIVALVCVCMCGAEKEVVDGGRTAQESDFPTTHRHSLSSRSAFLSLGSFHH
jgi:hypothetical protein